MAGPRSAIRRCSDPGLEIDHLFVSGAFNAFQARAQSKKLVTFAAGDGTATEACITLAGKEGVWSNPITGAFGGAAVSGPRFEAAVPELVRDLSDWLRGEADARAATFRLPPDCYPDPTAAVVENALFQNGWRLDHVDLDQYLPVMPPGAYVASLGETRQKELRRLLRSGAEFRSRDLAEGRAVYDVIARNRAERGYPMTMAWTDLQALAEAFPDRIGFHAVERDGEALAGAVVIRVAAHYAYVFYWGEDPAFRRESPVIMLAEGLMRLCNASGVAVLDIGISTEASSPNPGLMAFKTSLGCATASKRTYRLDVRSAARTGG